MEYFNKRNMMLVLGCMFLFYIYNELTFDNNELTSDNDELTFNNDEYLVRALNAHNKAGGVYYQEIFAGSDFYKETIDNLNKYWKYNSENIDNPLVLSIYVSAAKGAIGLYINNKLELARKAIELAPYDLDVYWNTYSTTLLYGYNLEDKYLEKYDRLNIIMNHDTKDKFLLMKQIDYLFRYFKNYKSYSEYVSLDSIKENPKKGFEQLPKFTENLLLSADKYISLYPNSWVGYYKKGLILEYLEEKNNVRKYYTKARSLYSPDSDVDLFESSECRILKKMKISLELDKYNLCAPDIREMEIIHNYLSDKLKDLSNFDSEDFKKIGKSPQSLKSFGVDVDTLDPIVIGTGSKEVVVFFDPNGVYCKRLFTQAQNLSQYSFKLLPIAFPGHKSASDVRKIFCAKDRTQILNSILTNSIDTLGQDKKCRGDSLQQTYILADLMEIYSVPFIIAPDGRIANGLPPDLDAFLSGE